jgi:hypothetical protein
MARIDMNTTSLLLTEVGMCVALAACGGANGDPATTVGTTTAPSTSGGSASSSSTNTTPVSGSPSTSSTGSGSGASTTGSGASITGTGSTTASGSASTGGSTNSGTTSGTGSTSTNTATPPPLATGPKLGGCEMFPATAIFNTRIDDTAKFPVHASSTAWKTLIASTNAPAGTASKMHLDWGTNTDAALPEYYGIPFNLVDGTSSSTAWPLISYEIVDPRDGNGAGVPGESDCAVADAASPNGFKLQRNCEAVAPANRKFPFPPLGITKVEGGVTEFPGGGGDSHALVLETGKCRLWESYFTYRVSGQWHSYSSAAWDLKSLALRPDTWGSGDAAGLPVLPLLARADEASTGEIKHALRVTFKNAAMGSLRNPNGHVWPARHAAGSVATGGVPFGALLRLKADFVIPANWSTQAKAIATAMKRYGLYVADNGGNFFVTGDPSAAWDLSNHSQLQNAITMNNMEFVDISAITRNAKFNKDSMAASW